MKTDNVVIKSVKEEDGPEIIKYFKSLGIDTRTHAGLHYEEDGNFLIYYGVIDGRFDNYSLENVKKFNAEIITLPMGNKVTWTRKQFKSLYNKACSTWRPKLVEMFPKFAFQDVCEITEEQYTEMYKACTGLQKKVMDNIFGKEPFKKKVMFMCTKNLVQSATERELFTKDKQYELVKTTSCGYTFMCNFDIDHNVSFGDWADYFYRID
jgi:hypothetical protein